VIWIVNKNVNFVKYIVNVGIERISVILLDELAIANVLFYF